MIISTKIVAENIKLKTNVDRINGVICSKPKSLKFVIGQDADVTVEVDGVVIDSIVNKIIDKKTIIPIYDVPVPIQGISLPAGKNEVFISRELRMVATLSNASPAASSMVEPNSFGSSGEW